MKLHWGNALVIYFAIFLTLAASFIIFSLKQNNDLEDVDYYNKGANYSTQIEINKRSTAYTDSIRITQTSETISINFSNYLANKAEAMHIHFYRPSNKKFDYQLTIDSLNLNNELSKAKLAKGRYIVKFTWLLNESDYALEQTVFID